jgi:trk system potassium uptake protein TrkA
MADKLHELHHEVLGIDNDERRVNDALPYVTNAMIGDATSETFIQTLGVRDFDLCVVAIGDDFQSSLEITALLKENGAPFVLSRATRDVHIKFLLRNGADQVVYPEKQMASWAAVRYSSDHIFDYVQLTEDHSIFETDIPESWIGKTAVELNVRRTYGINILATRRDGKFETLSGPDHRFVEGETIFILGSNQDIQKFMHF